jgi:hypothetical protein
MALSTAYKSRNVGDPDRALDGADVALPGITVVRFDGDRVRERFLQADMLGRRAQIGAAPAPA